MRGVSVRDSELLSPSEESPEFALLDSGRRFALLASGRPDQPRMKNGSAALIIAPLATRKVLLAPAEAALARRSSVGDMCSWKWMAPTASSMKPMLANVRS